MEIQEADPAARRRAIILLLAVTLVGSALLLLIELTNDDLLEWIASDPAAPRRSQIAIAGMIPILGLPPVVIGVYLWRLADTIRESGRWPPPGVGTVRPTTVRKGEQADAYSRALRWMALACYGSAFAIAILLLRISGVMTGEG